MVLIHLQWKTTCSYLMALDNLIQKPLLKIIRWLLIYALDKTLIAALIWLFKTTLWLVLKESLFSYHHQIVMINPILKSGLWTIRLIQVKLVWFLRPIMQVALCVECWKTFKLITTTSLVLHRSFNSINCF